MVQNSPRLALPNPHPAAGPSFSDEGSSPGTGADGGTCRDALSRWKSFENRRRAEKVASVGSWVNLPGGMRDGTWQGGQEVVAMPGRQALAGLLLGAAAPVALGLGLSLGYALPHARATAQNYLPAWCGQYLPTLSSAGCAGAVAAAREAAGASSSTGPGAHFPVCYPLGSSLCHPYRAGTAYLLPILLASLVGGVGGISFGVIGAMVGWRRDNAVAVAAQAASAGRARALPPTDPRAEIQKALARMLRQPLGRGDVPALELLHELIGSAPDLVEPLHLRGAVAANDAELLRALLRLSGEGASRCVQEPATRRGRSALALARECGNGAIVAILVEAAGRGAAPVATV